MTDKIYDVFSENCPSRKVLEIISNKWTILIIQKIATKTYRFGELNREIGGISKKVLSETLRSLECNGFIIRKEYLVLPLKVEYSLTELGKSLNAMLTQISDWAIENIDKIYSARQDYAR
jgi:DNA-binding HxlR family transcriptional regulator